MKSVKEFYQPELPFEEFDQTSKLQKSEGKSDNDILYDLQVEFLKNKNADAEAQLWLKFRLLCLKAIKKELHRTQMFLDADELEYRVDIACEYVLRRYKTYKAKGKTYIINNFVSAAYFGAKHSLYSESENDFILQQSERLEEAYNIKKMEVEDENNFYSCGNNYCIDFDDVFDDKVFNQSTDFFEGNKEKA